jgi:hypothetical protein
VTQKSNLGLGLIAQVPRSRTIRPTDTRQNFSERLISSSQRPLPAQHKTNKRDERPRVGLDPAIPVIRRQYTYALRSIHVTGDDTTRHDTTKTSGHSYLPAVNRRAEYSFLPIQATLSLSLLVGDWLV